MQGRKRILAPAPLGKVADRIIRRGQRRAPQAHIRRHGLPTGAHHPGGVGRIHYPLGDDPDIGHRPMRGGEFNQVTERVSVPHRGAATGYPNLPGDHRLRLPGRRRQPQRLDRPGGALGAIGGGMGDGNAHARSLIKMIIVGRRQRDRGVAGQEVAEEFVQSPPHDRVQVRRPHVRRQRLAQGGTARPAPGHRGERGQ